MRRWIVRSCSRLRAHSKSIDRIQDLASPEAIAEASLVVDTDLPAMRVMGPALILAMPAVDTPAQVFPRSLRSCSCIPQPVAATSPCVRSVRATRISDGRIWPRAGCASIVCPQRRPSDFLPLPGRPAQDAGTPGRRHSSRMTRKSPARRPALRCGPSAYASDAVRSPPAGRSPSRSRWARPDEKQETKAVPARFESAGFPAGYG
jgi:hypothetical protein